MPTVLEVIKSTTAYFEKHGVESPRLNAEHLAAHSLGKKKRLDLYMEFDRPLSEQELAPMRELVRGRAQGRPLQHLLGTTEFFGREFSSDARALIPRPETEQLVELVLAAPAGNPNPKILDVGTGSGVIAITLALELPQSSVTAIDLSPEALALAQANAQALQANVTFVQGDLLPEGAEVFDQIVANLPYIPTGDISALSREVQHDPVSALDGGDDGLDLVRKLITLSKTRLVPGGRIFLELGHDQAERVKDLFQQDGWRDVEAHKDLQGVQRFVCASI
jgi:release factor glutamine methyltransferase